MEQHLEAEGFGLDDVTSGTPLSSPLAQACAAAVEMEQHLEAEGFGLDDVASGDHILVDSAREELKDLNIRLLELQSRASGDKANRKMLKAQQQKFEARQAELQAELRR